MAIATSCNAATGAQIGALFGVAYFTLEANKDSIMNHIFINKLFNSSSGQLRFLGSV